MERMTIMTPKGAALKMDDVYPSEDAARAALMEKYRVAVDRLAAYEDTGLEPEEIDSIFVNSVMDENRRLKDELNRVQNKTNDPLTLDELREMVGGPAVWVVTVLAPDEDCYALITGIDDENVYMLSPVRPDDYGGIELYGDYWLAYRRKPEEAVEKPAEIRQDGDSGTEQKETVDVPLTMEELERMDGQPVWIDNGRGENKCYIVNNEYEIHGTVEPCGIDLWGAGTSLSLLVRCGLYREPPNREESA